MSGDRIDTLTFQRRNQRGVLVMVTLQRDAGESLEDFFSKVLDSTLYVTEEEHGEGETASAGDTAQN